MSSLLPVIEAALSEHFKQQYGAELAGAMNVIKQKDEAIRTHLAEKNTQAQLITTQKEQLAKLAQFNAERGAIQANAAIPGELVNTFDGRTAKEWCEVAANWQGRYAELLKESKGMLALVKRAAHMQTEIDAAKAEVNELRDIESSLMAEIAVHRSTQSGKDKELASMRAELRLCQEANRKLTQQLDKEPRDPFVSSGTEQKYQIHNGSVYMGNEIRENNRDAR